MTDEHNIQPWWRFQREGGRWSLPAWKQAADESIILSRERRARERRLHAMFATVALITFLAGVIGIASILAQTDWPLSRISVALYILPPTIVAGWLLYKYPIERRK